MILKHEKFSSRIRTLVAWRGLELQSSFFGQKVVVEILKITAFDARLLNGYHLLGFSKIIR